MGGKWHGNEVQQLDRSRQRFIAEVERRLQLPADAQHSVLQQLDAAVLQAGLSAQPPQHVLVVDRRPHAQAAFLVLRTPQGSWHWVGASPVSTGRVGSFDHFRTPLGVFTHSRDNLDFRAGGLSQMRLQVHATDAALLEPRLGRVGSKGCIRISAPLNVFLDRHGVLDADAGTVSTARYRSAALGAGCRRWPLTTRTAVVFGIAYAGVRAAG